MVTIGNMFNNLNNMSMGNNQNGITNIIGQLRQCQQNPGVILDILAQSGKINQQQYNDLQQYKNNPQQIANYLITNGYGNQINQIIQQLNQQ